jgi:hypothetical protein
MFKPTTVHTDQLAVHHRLLELGLGEEHLIAAILDGEAWREACTPHDPTNLPGTLAWGRTVRGLRDRLVPLDWTAEDVLNCPMVVSPDRRVAISVSTGNSSTAEVLSLPRPKYAKGAATVRAVQSNQLDLFLPAVQTEDEAPPTITWILLVSRTGDDIVRAELSRPASITEDGVITAWTERIILADIPVPAEPTLAFDEQGEEIVVDVQRRSAPAAE